MNTGKIIEAEIIIRKDEMSINDLNIMVTNMTNNSCSQPTINCNNVTAFWNNRINQLEISSLDDIGICNINCEVPNNTTPFNTYIMGLSGTTQGDGELVLENGYRYEGVNPNNYVMFNNELWRVLGVFSTEYDADNNGIMDESANLVKIIREDSIGGLAWDKSGRGDWPNSSLYHLLNEQYYDWENNKSNVSMYCYGYSTTTPSKCDYIIDGIHDEFRNMIINANWYLGGGGKSGYTTYTPDNIYSYERDANSIYTEVTLSTSTLGYIGLMYESDYLYSVLASNCDRTTTHNLYYSSNCAGQNWLHGKGYEWTITPEFSSFIRVWNINDSGYLNYGLEAYKGNSVRPVLYLSPSVYKISGSGSIIDPYIIGM